MNSEFIENVVAKAVKKLSLPTIEIEASGRHVHLNSVALDLLFGKGYSLTKVSDLSQPGQFVCKERVSIESEKKTLKNIVVLGPVREHSQVEISQTDGISLGVKVPVRQSGQIDNTPGIKLIGPMGEVQLHKGLIVAKRHIHITPEDAKKFGVIDQQNVSVQIFGDRGVTLHDVIVRVSPKFTTFMHIDYDEANAIGFNKGMKGLIVTK